MSIVVALLKYLFLNSHFLELHLDKKLLMLGNYQINKIQTLFYKDKKPYQYQTLFSIFTHKKIFILNIL